jgi:hypothetical protein
MGFVVVVLLGGLWASILVPAAVRSRRESSPIHSVDLFERSMGMLAPTKPTASVAGSRQLPGRYVMVLERPGQVARGRMPSPALERRRTVLTRLLAAVPGCGLLALVAGGIFVTIFWLSVLALGGYVALLVQIQARRADAAAKLRRLPTAGAPVAERPTRVAAGQR